jgi:hypothetical protein
MVGQENFLPHRDRDSAQIESENSGVNNAVACFIFRILAHPVYDDDPSCFAEGSAASVLDVVESARLL